MLITKKVIKVALKTISLKKPANTFSNIYNIDFKFLKFFTYKTNSFLVIIETFMLFTTYDLNKNKPKTSFKKN